jgi:hypothetical protein
MMHLYINGLESNRIKMLSAHGSELDEIGAVIEHSSPNLGFYEGARNTCNNREYFWNLL